MGAFEQLRGKRQQFVLEYLVDFNATQAAIRSGYSKKTAKAAGSMLLTYPDVKAALSEKREKKEQYKEVTREWVREQMRRIASTDIRKVYNLDGSLKNPHELDDETATGLASIEIENVLVRGSSLSEDPELANEVFTKRVAKIKRWDPHKSLEMLGKHLGLFDHSDDAEDDGAERVKIIGGLPDMPAEPEGDA